MARKARPKTEIAAPPPTPWLDRWWRRVLVVVLLLAAGLRLAYLEEAPPGMHQDEAANAWNAWCLLKTGKDQVGAPWPVFYFRALGEYRSPLYMYYLIPFQAMLGMSIWSMRFASGLAGVAAVALMYVVGSRLLGRGVGLLAAGLLALNPWAVQHSRWGHEATLCPLLALLPVAVLLWARMPFDFAQGKPSRAAPGEPSNDAERGGPNPWLAALGGAVAGIVCYGYPSVRIFLPVFLLLAVAATWRGWWRTLQTRRGSLAVAMMLVAGMATFGPLLYKHLTDPNIDKRARELRVYAESDSVGTKFEKILGRYPPHFGLDFLFLEGDHEFSHYCPPGYGEFHWYMLPLMVLGVVALVPRLRWSWGARLALLWVLLYPVGDLVSHTGGMFRERPHCLRSFPGLPGLILLGAAGGAWAVRSLWKRIRWGAWVGIALFGIAAVALNVRFYHHFFGEYSRKIDYGVMHTDLVQACKWLRPHLRSADSAFFTRIDTNQPYIVTAVALDYDPKRWHGPEGRDVNVFARDPHADAVWDMYTRYGNIHFMFGPSWLPAARSLALNGRDDRAYFVYRIGDAAQLAMIYQDVLAQLRDLPQTPEARERRQAMEEYRGVIDRVLNEMKAPIHTIIGPEGKPSLFICEARL